MSTTAKPFRNRENYAKYLALYFEPGLTVLLTTLKWCYNGQLPIKDHLADLGATNSLRKTNNINVTEQKSLDELKGGKSNLNNLDITLLYKIIQLTCDLRPRNDIIWTKDCPTAQQGELEFLLFKLKDGRNSLAHPHDEHKNITDSMVEDKCEEMKDLLTKLLQTAALKGNVFPVELNDVVDHIKDDIQRILREDNVCDSMRPHTLNLILSDLKSKAFSNNSILEELGEYSVPLLKNIKDLKSISLKKILQLNKTPVIVVQGEAGRGKTFMSRYLFYSWLTGNTDSVEGLSSFDIVLIVECNQISSRDINLFYETLFPNASFAFPKTNSFKRSLDEFRVFWIMDGFDESTPEFKGFLTAMTKSLSDKHKLLITTRPNTYGDLEGYLCKLSMTSLTLELFQDHNVHEIIQSLIIDNEKKEAFLTHFHSLDETAKHLLRTPLNLNLYIKLWIQNPDLVRDTFTTKMLFLETVRNNLSLLKKRLVGRTSWSSEDLKGYVNDWFYGSLCRQSLLMLMQRRYNTICTVDLDILKRDARNSKLDPSSCLSTFLVQVKEGNEENKEETRYAYYHFVQQHIMAFLFLKHFEEYQGDKVIASVNKDLPLELLQFYVEMTIEDGSLEKDPTRVFSTIQKIANIYKIKHRFDYCYMSDIWFFTCIASNFNSKYMEIVNLAFKDISFLKIHRFIECSHVTKFLEFVHPSKVEIENRFIMENQEGFQSLLDILIQDQIEVELHVDDDWMFDEPSNPAFCGDFENFKHLLPKLKKKLKKICLSLHCIEFLDIGRKNIWSGLVLQQQENENMEQLEIWIDLKYSFEGFYLLPDFQSLPKKIIEITTIGLININRINFKWLLEFIAKLKGDQSLKFQAIHLDMDHISAPIERRLLEFAHTVSNDSICQCKKYCIQKTVNLNVTAFGGTIQSLNAMNIHHANLKSIFMDINHEEELCKMFKFLHRNRTTLSEVKLKLTRQFSTDGVWDTISFLDNKRILPLARSFPKVLVPHTTLFIENMDKENFSSFFTLLRKVKDPKWNLTTQKRNIKTKKVKVHENLKFNEIRIAKCDNPLSRLQREKMLDQITNNLKLLEDSDEEY